MYETEEYEYWLFGTQKSTREVLTAEAWWSYILRFLGVMIGIPCLIGFLDRKKAINKYEKAKAVKNTIKIFKILNN